MLAFHPFDALNRVTNMVDAAGKTIYAYSAGGQLWTENGPWASETVTNTHNNRLRIGLLNAMVDILVAQKRQLDVPQPWKPGMKLNDPWGNRFRIIVQQIDSNQPPIITVTNHHR